MFSTTPTEDLDQLVAALVNGRNVKVYDDGFGQLYVYGHEFGPTLVIRAQDFDSAYSIAIDEQRPIPFDEVPEAHGYDSAEELNRATCDGDYWDDVSLVEGYQHQSNATGSGIVNVGHYEWLQPADSLDVTPIYSAW